MQNHNNGSCSIFVKTFMYLKIGLHVIIKYRKHFSPSFVYHAAILLFSFWHNKMIKLANGTYKLHLYIPAYPTRAFFKSVEDKLIENPPRPITIVYSVTKACTYKCGHCYQRKDKGADIPKDLMLKTIKDITDAGVTFLNIEGGDAFLRFDDLCAILDSIDDSVEVWINTTGANVTKEKLLILKEKGCYGYMVSLHGDTKEKHDSFVGIDGAFEQAINTLKLCHELGIGAAINTVLEQEKINDGSFIRLMDIAKDLKVNFVQLIHPKRAGLWLGNDNLADGDKNTIEYVLKAHKYYNNSFRSKYPALPAQVEEEHPNKFGCTAGGVDRFYIGASGEVQPCEFLNISFGNIKEESFAVIFARMREYFKVPCQDWLCTTQAGAISDLMKKYNLDKTPIPFEYTQELLKEWNRGEKTKLYKKLGLYQ
ncbi:radical SAM protein [bacterium]|nr:radical SAM protein [bacterium]